MEDEKSSISVEFVEKEPNIEFFLNKKGEKEFAITTNIKESNYKIFEGRILQIVEQSIDFVRDQIKEHTYLGREGKFVTESEYPEFAWKEIIVNAIAHRDYSIKGTYSGKSGHSARDCQDQ